MLPYITQVSVAYPHMPITFSSWFEMIGVVSASVFQGSYLGFKIFGVITGIYVFRRVVEAFH